ncbi:lysine acetyltransferase protein [Rutstroemia sp. NJR-2017a WRK4]|nr:lysine acetyltransferase protein [Rutstroemia sp. NJR-2017a WRK4]
MEHIPNLPDSSSSTLILSHPTPEECTTIWTSTSSSWKDSLPTSTYLRESQYLTTVPLAKNGGLTLWILVDRSQSPRTILCSCETFRKRSLVSNASGRVRDVFVHGVASVFCEEKYRGRGYAGRMMRELKSALSNWQEDICGVGKCVGSVLYSDIGKEYYAKFGWRPTPTNTHVMFKPVESVDRWWQGPETCISKEDLPALCGKDEVMIRKAMSVPVDGDAAQERFSIVPDVDHMLWHMGKEEFTCNILFGKVPEVKGAIAGPEDPADRKGDNTLYILRIVVERDYEESNESTNALEPCGTDWLQRQFIGRSQLAYLETVLRAAQNEAEEWKLDQVKLWHPTPEITRMLSRLDIGHVVEEREEYSIASVLWFDRNGGEGPPPLWINNEHYAWC